MHTQDLQGIGSGDRAEKANAGRNAGRSEKNVLRRYWLEHKMSPVLPFPSFINRETNPPERSWACTR